MSIHGHQKRDGCEVCKCYDPCSATGKLVHPYIIEDLLILEDPERVSFIVIFYFSQQKWLKISKSLTDHNRRPRVFYCVCERGAGCNGIMCRYFYYSVVLFMENLIVYFSFVVIHYDRKRNKGKVLSFIKLIILTFLFFSRCV